MIVATNTRSRRYRAAVESGVVVSAALLNALISTAQAAGPSFDCAKIGRDALSTIICSSPQLSERNLSLAQTYYALRHQIGALGHDALKQEAAASNVEMKQNCRVPSKTPLPLPEQTYVTCIKSETDRVRAAWLSRLTDADLQEAQRPTEQLISAQRQLVKQGLLPQTTSADGVFGDGTRTALSDWQAKDGLPAIGALDDKTAGLLLGLPVNPTPTPRAILATAPEPTAKGPVADINAPTERCDSSTPYWNQASIFVRHWLNSIGTESSGGNTSDDGFSCIILHLSHGNQSSEQQLLVQQNFTQGNYGGGRVWIFGSELPPLIYLTGRYLSAQPDGNGVIIDGYFIPDGACNACGEKRRVRLVLGDQLKGMLPDSPSTSSSEFFKSLLDEVQREIATVNGGGRTGFEFGRH
jgi:hypothetical protein